MRTMSEAKEGSVVDRARTRETTAPDQGVGHASHRHVRPKFLGIHPLLKPCFDGVPAAEACMTHDEPGTTEQAYAMSSPEAAQKK